MPCRIYSVLSEFLGFRSNDGSNYGVDRDGVVVVGGGLRLYASKAFFLINPNLKGIIMNMLKKIGAGTALVASAAPAFAVDVTGATGELTEGLANVTSIGAAVLLIAVAIAVFKYVRKAF